MLSTPPGLFVSGLTLTGACDKLRIMICASCSTRKAKRACPALGRSICPTCCGTKRLKEIHCPSDCVYLASAQAHPPAVVQRQRERDMPFLIGMIEGLTAAQGDALSVLHARIRAHRAAAIPTVHDDDVEEAVRALAATLETASRGILYEHRTQSVPALRLQQDLREALAQLAERGERAPGPAVLAAVLRRIETTSQKFRRGQASDTAFLDFLDRIARPQEAQPHVEPPAPPRILV
jgi:hypothetical protein